MDKRLVGAVGGLAFAVSLFWWSAWQPGFIDADGIERMARLRSFDLTTDDPALYTVVLWVITIGGRTAALATLLQGAAWAVVAAAWARRLHQNGARSWAAAIATTLVAILPAIAVGLLGLWPQTVIALTAAWLLVELATPEWSQPSVVRTGIALGALGSLGLVGAIAAATVAVVVIFGQYRPSRQQTIRLVSVAVALGLASWLLLPWVFSMERGRAEATSAAPVVAAAVTHHLDDLPAADLANVSAIADVALWQELYDCGDSGLLLDDREFNIDAVTAADMRSLAAGAFVRHPFTTAGQRLCATVSLMGRGWHGERAYSLPDYTVFPNDIGIKRDPVLEVALDATKAILIRTQQPNRLTWWFRPALPLLLAGVTYVALALRRKRTAMGAGLAVGLLLGLFIAGPRPEFIVAFPLYVVGWLSTTLVVTLRN